MGNGNISIYVLELVGKKFYVGKSARLSERIIEHFSKCGSEWTKIYTPLKVLKVYENCTVWDEDKYTKMYMNIYGIDNVRGGSYCKRVLTPSEKQIIENELRGARDQCFRCGSNEHFVNECPNLKPNLKPKPKPRCDICNRNSHFASNCFARTKLDGTVIIREQEHEHEHDLNIEKEFMVMESLSDALKESDKENFNFNFDSDSNVNVNYNSITPIIQKAKDLFDGIGICIGVGVGAGVRTKNANVNETETKNENKNKCLVC